MAWQGAVGSRWQGGQGGVGSVVWAAWCGQRAEPTRLSPGTGRGGCWASLCFGTWRNTAGLVKKCSW